MQNIIKTENNKGIALIIVLWITVILSSITMAGAYLARLEMRQANYPAKELQLISVAMSCIEKVKYQLIKDTNMYDSLKEGWKSSFKDNLTIGDVTASITVEDEASKFNLNTASPDRLKLFAPLSSAGNSNEMIDSLIDWEDTDSIPLPSGGENNYYRALETPITCKNSPLDSIKEIALIKGFKDPKVLGEILKYITVYSDGRININTAPAEVLMTLPNIDYQLAQAIIARRNGKDLQQGTEDDLPYDNLRNLEEIIGKDVYKAVERLITVKSSYFRVTVKTNMGKYSKIVQAILFRQGMNVQIKYWNET